MNERKSKHSVAVTAAEINKYNRRKTLLGFAAISMAVFLGLIYVISMLYKETGSFTISINKYEMTKYGISLSESRELINPSSFLNAHIDAAITNIAEKDIPANVDSVDGEHNGKNYVAYSFYLFNAGDVEFDYEWRITMSNISNSIDEAIRLKLYVNGEPTVYAKTASDGSGAEPGTTQFFMEPVLGQCTVSVSPPGSSTSARKRL